MNRRKLLSLLGLSPALLAGSVDAQTAPKNKKSAAQPANSDRVMAHNPKGTPPPIKLFPMAPRLDTVEGKTIYLVDTGFAGGGLLLQQMQLWFKQNMPGVTTVFRRKAGPYVEDDPVLWKEIKEKGNAAIMAIGH
jgi:hypothetical protein